MKPWCMDQFTTVFSNDFRVYSLISKSRVDGSGLFIVQTVSLLPCVPSTERSLYRWLVIVARDGSKCRPIINCLFVLLYFFRKKVITINHMPSVMCSVMCLCVSSTASWCVPCYHADHLLTLPLTVDLWPVTVNYNARRAIVMPNHGQRSVCSKAGAETDGHDRSHYLSR